MKMMDRVFLRHILLIKHSQHRPTWQARPCRSERWERSWNL